MFAISPFASRLTDRLGAGRLVLVGVGVTVTASLPFTQIGPRTSFLHISIAMAIRGLGIGVAFTPAFAAGASPLWCPRRRPTN